MFYVKTIFGSDIRRFALALPDFAVLESVLQATYGKPGVPFTVRYEDDDGDVISVSSNAELEEAVKCKAPKTLVFRVAPMDAQQDSSVPAGQSDCEIVSIPSSPSLTHETGDWNICDDLESNEPQEDESSVQETEQKETKTAESPVKVEVEAEVPGASSMDDRQRRKAQKCARKAAKTSFKKEKKERAALPVPVCSKPAVHSNVRCDNCGTFPVVGNRYKCTVCEDYDLCATCEAQGNHSPHHPFVKFKRPEVTRHEGVQCNDCGVYPIPGDRFKCMVCPQYDMCDSCEKKRLHDATHPLVKLRVEMSSLAPAVIAAASVADGETCKCNEVPEAVDAEEPEEKDSKKDARKAEKREARRKEKDAKKAERKAKKEAKKGSEPAVAQPVVAVQEVAQPEQPVSPVAPVVTVKVAEPEPSPIPLAMPVTPSAPAESLLAAELEEKLQILAALGFTDRQHMCMLLSRFNGDLQRVADALLFV